jgi:hypothetical protein
VTAVAALGAFAFLIAVAFACTTFERWIRGRALHQLAWSISLVMFALGSLAYWWGGATGWHSLNFRLFYLFGAILNVPYLALGTVTLLWGERLGRRMHRVLDISAAVCAGVVLSVPLRTGLPTRGLPVGKEVFGVAPRIMAAVGSGVGATVLIVGAVFSAIRLIRLRRKGGAWLGPVSPGRLALTNTLIAGGSFVLSLGGTFFTGTEAELAFGVFLATGIVILFAGFLCSSSEAPTAATRPDGLSEFANELWDIAQNDDAMSATGAAAR